MFRRMVLPHQVERHPPSFQGPSATMNARSCGPHSLMTLRKLRLLIFLIRTKVFMALHLGRYLLINIQCTTIVHLHYMIDISLKL